MFSNPILFLSSLSIFYSRQTSIDPTKAVQEDIGTGVELDLADPITLEWEKLVADVMLNHSNGNITVLANVARR